MRDARWQSLIALLLATLLTAAGGEAEPSEPTQEATADVATGGSTEGPTEESDATEAAAATDAPNPLAGETITFVVGVGPGGGYDAYARLLAPFLGEQLDADVIVQNTPGAGGLLALNELLAAEADGTCIMLANGSGVGGSALAEAEGVQFELDELAYVGRVYAGDKVVVTGTGSSYQTVQDLTGTGEPFTFGSSGPGASTYVEPTVLSEMLDWNATMAALISAEPAK